MNPTQTTASGGMTLITGIGREVMSRQTVEREQELRRTGAQHSSGAVSEAA